MDYIYAKLNYEVKESPDYTIAENETPAPENLHEYNLLKDGVAVGDVIVIPKSDLYWQGTTSALLGDIISNMLEQPLNSTRPDNPDSGEMADVYELRVKMYNDTDNYEGATLIYVPLNTAQRIHFYLDFIQFRVDHSTNLTVVIPDASYFGYRVVLRLVSRNQEIMHDWS